jgi:6-phosphogluconolactonase
VVAVLVYVGSWTRQDTATGIRLCDLDTSSGVLVEREQIEGAGTAFFLTLHPHRPLLFAVDGEERFQGADSGAISAFAVDPATGSLTLLNRQPTHGTLPCYVSVEPTGRYALVANYSSGSAAVFPIEADGRLGEATDVVQHAGSGPHGRQEGPHPHFIAPDPRGECILACDLGIDRVVVYRLDPASGRLRPNDPPAAPVGAGAGPRHLAFSQDGRQVYVIDELDSTLVAFSYAASQGTLQPIHTVSTLPAGFTDENYPAHVLVAPSGRFLYGSNRGHNSIAIFAVQPESGRVTPLGHEPSRGTWPWNFAIDPAGTFMLVANQRSHGVATFRLDPQRGTLQATERLLDIPAPTCVIFGRT